MGEKQLKPSMTVICMKDCALVAKESSMYIEKLGEIRRREK
jgi:hypothetical protein